MNAHTALMSLGNTKGPKTLSYFFALNSLFNNPFNYFKSIHVAGTNGKGSVCLKLSKALEASHYNVGLYTSPHLYKVNERIQINGVPISDDDLFEISNQVFTAAKQLDRSPTFFEAMTLIAFEYFKKKQVDIAVLETGIGGRLDSTNIVTPILSVITSIGYDHTELLGETLEKIAFEKAGIIKPGVPVVVGPKANYPVILQKAQTENAPYYKEEGIFNSYDEENTAVVNLSLKVLARKLKLADSSILKKAISLRPPCRFEIDKGVVFDVAHNTSGIEKLLQMLKMNFPDKDWVFVCGFSKDKDIVSCLQLLQQAAKRSFLCVTCSAKSAKEKELQEIIDRFRIQNTQIFSSVEEGIKALAPSFNKDTEILIVTGSFYVMQSAKNALQDLCF